MAASGGATIGSHHPSTGATAATAATGGTATPTSRGGDGLWPLRIGAQKRWTRTARSSTGRSHQRVTTCNVDDAVEVLRDNHPPTPAFVVACNDGKRERTTWWAPEEGPVAFRVVHGEKGIEELWVRD